MTLLHSNVRTKCFHKSERYSSYFSNENNGFRGVQMPLVVLFDDSEK